MRVRRGLRRWFAWVVSVGVAVPILALTAPLAGAAPPGGLPPGLRPTEKNLSPETAHKYGESQIAVNPTNPDNLVSVWVKDSFTLACQAASDPSCDLLPTTIQGLGPIGVSPRGYFTVPRFVEAGTFVSFNHGQSWKRVLLPLSPPGHPEFINQGDPSVTAGPDGTFYASWDAFNWNEPDNALPNGGIAVSKSTDGGLTWSDPVLSGTALDNDKLTADLSTGKVYEASQGAIGRLATGNPNDPLFPPNSPTDRYLVASSGGVNWSTPRGLGGLDGTTYRGVSIGAGNPFMSAANGVLAAIFRSTNGAACNFFVGAGAPCIVFQTTTDDGATWTRHPVPASVIAGNVSVAADPSTPGHYTVAGSNSAGTQFAVYQTHDSGVTWTGPTMVADPAPFTKFFLWTTYSPTGDFGMVWRARQEAGTNTPFLVWATISHDGGATFAAPLQVSGAASPANPPPQFNAAGDDYSNIAFGQDRLFVSWADRRGPNGERNAFVGTVKLEAFNH